MGRVREKYYFDSFVKSMNYACEEVKLLKKCLESQDLYNLKVSLEDMHTLEHAADMCKHEMMGYLMKEFLPPIDREDIVDLSLAIDDVVDAVEDVLRCMYMYNITRSRKEVMPFIDVVTRSCNAMHEMGKELPRFKNSLALKSKIIEINALEEEADRLYTEAIRRLFVEKKDPIYILSWTTIFNALEKCCDKCEHVADTVEQIIMKNS